MASCARPAAPGRRVGWSERMPFATPCIRTATNYAPYIGLIKSTLSGGHWTIMERQSVSGWISAPRSAPPWETTSRCFSAMPKLPLRPFARALTASVSIRSTRCTAPSPHSPASRCGHCVFSIYLWWRPAGPRLGPRIQSSSITNPYGKDDLKPTTGPQRCERRCRVHAGPDRARAGRRALLPRHLPLAPAPARLQPAPGLLTQGVPQDTLAPP